eukprot:5020462-Amphidinium_carterae.1
MSHYYLLLTSYARSLKSERLSWYEVCKSCSACSEVVHSSLVCFVLCLPIQHGSGETQNCRCYASEENMC